MTIKSRAWGLSKQKGNAEEKSEKKMYRMGREWKEKSLGPTGGRGLQKEPHKKWSRFAFIPRREKERGKDFVPIGGLIVARPVLPSSQHEESDYGEEKGCREKKGTKPLPREESKPKIGT